MSYARFIKRYIIMLSCTAGFLRKENKDGWKSKYEMKVDFICMD